MKTRAEMEQELQKVADQVGELVGWTHWLASKQLVDLNEYRRVRVLVQNARILLDQAVWEMTSAKDQNS